MKCSNLKENFLCADIYKLEFLYKIKKLCRKKILHVNMSCVLLTIIKELFIWQESFFICFTVKKLSWYKLEFLYKIKKLCRKKILHVNMSCVLLTIIKELFIWQESFFICFTVKKLSWYKLEFLYKIKKLCRKKILHVNMSCVLLTIIKELFIWQESFFICFTVKKLSWYMVDCK